MFSLAALLEFYHLHSKNAQGYYGARGGIPYPVRDDQDVLECFWEHREDTPEKLVRFCGETVFPEIGGIPKLAEQLAGLLADIRQQGIRTVFDTLMDE